jgi:hypothetical protein
VLATSRLGGWPQGIAPVEVSEWGSAEAVAYLMAASRRPDLGETEAAAIAEALGRLPLALSHAAAYLRENANATVASYLAALGARMNAAPADADYPRAVFATFRAQIEDADARAPGARAVLSLAAFYAPDDVPEELFQQPPEHYPAALAAVVADPLRLEQALGALDRLSLIDFAPDTRTFQVHRLEQAAARDALTDEASAYPGPDFRTGPQLSVCSPTRDQPRSWPRTASVSRSANCSTRRGTISTSALPTPTQSRSTNARSRSAKERWGRTTPMSAPRSTTSRAFIMPRASTTSPSRSTNAPAPS